VKKDVQTADIITQIILLFPNYSQSTHWRNTSGNQRLLLAHLEYMLFDVGKVFIAFLLKKFFQVVHSCLQLPVPRSVHRYNYNIFAIIESLNCGVSTEKGKA